MLNPMSLELLAEQIQREHRARAAHAALLAQLPRPAAAHSAIDATSLTARRGRASFAADLTNSARLRLANALRALAIQLDPAAACDPGLVRIVNSR
jgi:hypothetical protein